MSSLLADLRFAFRILTRSPWFTSVAVLTLALGIGANTALFSLLDAVLLRALPFRDPDRLVAIWGQDAQRTGWRVPISLTAALRDRATTIEAISIHNVDGGSLRTPEGPVTILGQHVSHNFVEMMGLAPLAGRGFLPQEESPGAPAVMTIRFGFWQKYLGGDPAAIGHTLYLDETPYTVVGIMPAVFRDYLGTRADYWTPYGSEQIQEIEREIGNEVLARLAPGVTLEESLRELQAIAATAEVKEWQEAGRVLGMRRLKDEIVGDSAYALQLLLAAVAVVLAIACANLAQLLLARSDRRINEFATRKALGAPASQLFRLALMESLLLSLAGGAAAVALAYWLLPAMLALAPSEIPRISEAAIDGRVLAVAMGLTGVTGAAFGFAPALRLSKLSVMDAMKRAPGNVSAHRARLRSALVVGQVASSVALFVLAGLIGQTFLTLLPSNPGFEAESRTVRYVGVDQNLYPDAADRVRRLEELIQRVEAIPGIVAAGFGTNIPFGGTDRRRQVSAFDGASGDEAALHLSADLRAISPNFFQLLQMPLLRGRVFTSADRSESAGVAIVNETLARKLAPRGEALGRKVGVGNWGALPEYEIVGVIADVRSSGTTTEVVDEIYIPHAQSKFFFGYLIVRSALDSAALEPLLQSEIRFWAPTSPHMPWMAATPLQDLIDRSLAGPRFSATLISAFSGMALLLAAIGLFGLVAYSVSQRRQELGIRAALGARPQDLVMTATRSAVTLSVVGISVGLAAAVYLTRFVESQLYAVEPLDPLTFLGAAGVMLAVAGLASYIPARRAARVDPMVALRHD
ncbi:MAG: ABC transporter permease [Bryobacterales bacterium]